MRYTFRAVVLAGLSAAAMGASSAAHADIFAQYFTVQTDGRDFGPLICCFANHDEVLNTLGPNGLPVWNSTPSDPGNSPTLLDRNLTTNELLWWTPSAAAGANNPQVTATGTSVITGNSFSDDSFYPTNGAGGNDASGFQTAIFSGSFNLNSAQTIDFSLGADDDALLFVDGHAAVILGGIHGETIADNDVSLSSGSHTFELFYADRQQTGAALDFSIPNDVVVNPTGPGVPEPAAWALMVGGFGLAGAALRRRRTAAATA
jgi:fibro-slime domain-containing protein